MADLKTQFGFTDSLFNAINEVRASATTGADGKLKEDVDTADFKIGKDGRKVRSHRVVTTNKAKEVEEESHQSKTTMKHISNPNAAEKKAAKDIKPGIKGVKDRLDMLKAAKDRGALKEEELEESFSSSQIAALKAEYSKINGIDPSSDNYKKLIAMLDKLDLASLKSLAGADIKFVSGLAKNRVMRKSVKEEVEELDELSTKTLAKAAKSASDPDSDYHYGKSHDPQKFADHAKKTKDAKSAAAVQGAADAKSHYPRDNHTQGHDKLADRTPSRVTASGKANKQDTKALKSKLQREAFESLYELSKDTLKSYAKKAVGDLHKQGVKQNDQKAVARYKGLHKAVDKLSEEEVDIEEGTGDLKPGWMLKKDPELAKKVKEKQDLAKKREASHGDKSAGKSVTEGIMDKIKAMKRGMDAKAKAADHFDKAGDPTNPNKSKDLKRAVKYHNLVNKEETEVEEELSPAQKAIDKNKNGKIDGQDLAAIRNKKKPQGADFAAARRKERMDKNGRMDEESIDEENSDQKTTHHNDYDSVVDAIKKHAAKHGLEVDHDHWMDKHRTKASKKTGKTKAYDDPESKPGNYVKLKKDGKSTNSKIKFQVHKKLKPGGDPHDSRDHRYELSNMHVEEFQLDEEVKVGDKVSFDHPMKAIPGKTMKKIGTVHKVEDDTVHIKVKDKYGVITHKKSASELTKEEFESIDEAPKYDNKYTIYHKDYSSAVQHAAVHAGKQGYEIDHDDWDRVVAMGPKKPSAGKTNILSVSLKKDGKESKKKLHMQVYNMDNKGYELNTYVEEVQLDELNKDTLYSYAKKSEKDQDDQYNKIGKGIRDKDPKAANAAGHKFSMRSIGQNRAEKRLNKEEVSVNEAAKQPTKKFKDMKKSKLAGTKSEEGTSKKGEPLSGKKEPIEVNPDLHKTPK